MEPTAFAVTYDYRCPFARNIHEHLVVGLRAGAPWDVTFSPFSLTQTKVEEGSVDAWDDPAARPTLLALEAGIVVRRRMPERFLDVHEALFAARHDLGGDVREREVIAAALESVGVDSGPVLVEMAEPWPLEEIKKAHHWAADTLDVFGVPTFIVDGRSVFVRVMSRPGGDGAVARRTVDRILALINDAPELNEFKYTTITR